MAAELNEKTRKLLDGPTFVVLATVQADGSPQASPIWAKRDGNDVIMSTVIGRQKERNLRRSPKASVVVVDPENPYSYVEIRGDVTLTEDGGPELIQELSQKYTGGPYTADGPDARRVVVRVAPTRITGMG